jgi:hypothetical protein
MMLKLDHDSPVKILTADHTDIADDESCFQTRLDSLIRVIREIRG